MADLRRIQPSRYPKLRPGSTYFFQAAKLDSQGYRFGEPEVGRLVYAQARKNYRYDDQGRPTDVYDWVAWRCGYEPIACPHVHLRCLEAGHFRILEVPRG